MSQSDYIKYIRISTQLLLDASKNQLPVMNSTNYLDYKEYVLENTIKNTNIINNLLTPSGEQIIFNMERMTAKCPTTYECINTNKRENRTPMSSTFFTPVPQPLNWKQKKNASWLKNECVCSLNSVRTLKNICKCKTKF
jgi:hypothetical protein